MRIAEFTIYNLKSEIAGRSSGPFQLQIAPTCANLLRQGYGGQEASARESSGVKAKQYTLLSCMALVSGVGNSVLSHFRPVVLT